MSSNVLDAQDSLVGKTIEGYELLARLGKGGFGAVYLAKHPRLPDAKVAVKHIRLETPKVRELVQQEIQVLASLNHPQVVRIYDAFNYDEHQLIMMEYISGGTLKDIIETLAPGKLIERPIILQGMTELAQALEYIHSRPKPVLHLDLKPANILLDPVSETAPPRFVMTDFGLAQFTQSDGAITAMGAGTPLYMSPEQFGMGNGKTDRRSDIYSFGVMLYELLTGQPPFKGRNPVELLNHHAYSPVPLPPPHLQLPDALIHIILRCMEKAPESRFQTAGEVAHALLTAAYQAPAVSLSGGVSPQELAKLAKKASSEREKLQVAARAPQVSFSLTIMKPDGTQEVRTFEKSPIIIGRHPSVDFVLGDPAVSRQHVQVDCLGGQLFITDLNSASGTNLNGKALSPHQQIPWQGNQYLNIVGFTLLPSDVIVAPSNQQMAVTITTREVKRLLDREEAQKKAPRVKMSVESREMMGVQPGSPTFISVTLQPQDTPAAYYSLRASGRDTDESWYILPQPKYIESGQQDRLEIGIMPPLESAQGGRTYEIVLEVFADNPAIPMPFRVVKLIMERKTGFSVTLDPAEITHGRNKKAQLMINNHGNVAENFLIRVEGSNELRVIPAQNTVVVPAKRDMTIPISFKPRRGAKNMIRILYKVNITGTLSGRTEVTRGSYVFLPPPAWVGSLRSCLSFLMVIAVLLALASYLGAENVNTLLDNFLQAIGR